MAKILNGHSAAKAARLSGTLCAGEVVFLAPPLQRLSFWSENNVFLPDLESWIRNAKYVWRQVVGRPDSIEIRLAVRRARSRRGKIRLTVRQPRDARRRIVEPLRGCG